jgi:succinate dehydrogenase flavin-adding protein (antitoxin of CptAB toxin-antitoxin module)
LRFALPGCAFPCHSEMKGCNTTKGHKTMLTDKDLKSLQTYDAARTRIFLEQVNELGRMRRETRADMAAIRKENRDCPEKRPSNALHAARLGQLQLKIIAMEKEILETLNLEDKLHDEFSRILNENDWDVLEEVADQRKAQKARKNEYERRAELAEDAEEKEHWRLMVAFNDVKGCTYDEDKTTLSYSEWREKWGKYEDRHRAREQEALLTGLTQALDTADPEERKQALARYVNGLLIDRHENRYAQICLLPVAEPQNHEQPKEERDVQNATAPIHSPPQNRLPTCEPGIRFL